MWLTRKFPAITLGYLQYKKVHNPGNKLKFVSLLFTVKYIALFLPPFDP